jgi:sugar O-acyltransferase (sialic acid O-acetyltransferase NeuD family)
VLVDILLRQNREIKAIISPDDISGRPIFKGIQHLKSDDDIFRFSSSDVELVNAIGTAPRSTLRRRINEKYINQGYRFAKVIAECAFISKYADIHDGVQILTSAVIHPGAVINAHCVVNTGAIVEHDCFIGAYNFIAPRATLCGQVRTGENVFIGAGATVIPNLSIGNEAIVTAGTILTSSLDAGRICYPCRTEIK